MPTPKLSEAATPAVLAERIRAAILEHRLEPGAKLTEAQLCEVFGVKRGTVRQALSLLATEHLVDLEPNRGAFVASPSLREVHEVFEMRRIVEAAVIERVCASVGGQGPGHLKALAAMIARERRAFEQRDFRTWIRLSGEFHTALAELTGNRVLCDCLGGLVARSTLISALYESLGRSPCSFDEHAQIVEAIEAGQPAQAAQLMVRHLQTVELKMLDRPTRGAADLRDVFGA